MSIARLAGLLIGLVFLVWLSGLENTNYWQGVGAGVLVCSGEALIIRIEKWARWKWGK